jgi:hypothetical protein
VEEYFPTLVNDTYKNAAAHGAQRLKDRRNTNQVKSDGLAAAGTVAIITLAALLAIHALATWTFAMAVRTLSPTRVTAVT